MSFIEIFFTALALSADAFAVAVSKGLSLKKYYIKNSLTVGIYFGFFQGLMPLIGFILAKSLEKIIVNFDHWIAFVLLLIIGINMIYESFSSNEENLSSSLSFSAMLPLSFATSIDALAAGVSLSAVVNKNYIFFVVSLITVITFLISAIGVKMGNVFGTKYKSKAEMLGGVILILIGAKILLQDLM